VVDTTGAGDNFNSGFLFGQINGFSLANSLRIANICGGLSVEGFGGASTSPTREQALALL
jgi:sugar/nucleoside kinase (ribokinase family)